MEKLWRCNGTVDRGQRSGDGPESCTKYRFNPKAKPFVYVPKRCTGEPCGDTGSRKRPATPPPKDDEQEDEVGYVGPTHLQVNKRIWSSISSYSLEDIARAYPPPPPVVRPAASKLTPFPIAGSNTGGYHKVCCEHKVQQHHATCPASHPFGPMLLTTGIIQLQLRDAIVVQMTLNAVRVINSKKNIAISVSSDMTAAAMQHPNGVVYQNDAQVEIVACDAKKSNNYIRYAKMWQKGISFTSDGCAVIYLVDLAGTRTTSDLITMDLQSDYVHEVFYRGISCGVHTMLELQQIVRRSSYHLGTEGSLVYQINGYRITQGSDGLVKLSGSNNQYSIRTSPSNGSATVTTPNIHCTASLGATSHLFVRREEKRMHFDGAVFIVRNAGHSAGLDEFNRLRVY